MRQMTGDNGRDDPVGEAGQEARQADQVGLILAAEVAGACKKRCKEGDLRPTRQTEHHFFQQQQPRS